MIDNLIYYYYIIIYTFSFIHILFQQHQFLVAKTVITDQ